MAEQPQRPRFRDGQALSAADLELVIDHARDRAARHDRALHTPGIALGLALRADDVPMSLDGRAVLAKRLTVTAGIADDGNGIQIVLPADEPLPPEQFETDIGGSVELDDTAAVPGASYPYPVLLTAYDRDGPPPAFSGQDCGATTGPTRVIEDVQIRIGRRGEHLTLAAQGSLGPGDAVGDAGLFRLLLGFVIYHRRLHQYVGTLTELDHIRPQRAGVRAGQVITADDRLLLRVGEPPAPGQPALVLDTAGGGRMRFGRTTADGGLDDVLSISTGGAVTVRGTINPGLVVGTAQMQSGIATDGMPLPLPPGVADTDVQQGKVALHIQVTPRFPPPTNPPQAYAVVRCEVDALRRVHCELQALNNQQPFPAECNFLMAAAAVAATASGGSS